MLALDVRSGRIAKLAVAGALFLTAAACGSAEGDGGDAGGEVTIAVLIPETGPDATPEIFKDPISMLEEKVNAAGGIDGDKVRTVVYDSGLTPAEGLAATKRALADGPDLIMGLPVVSQVLAVSKTIAAAEIPFIQFAPTEGAELDYGFSIKSFNGVQASFAAKYLVEELDAKKIGIMYVDSTYGQEAEEAAAKAIGDAGGEVVAKRAYAADATDLTEQVLAMRGADAVINWGYPSTIGLQLKQFLQNGIKVPTIASDSGALTFVNKLANQAAMKDFYSTAMCSPVSDDRPAVKEWVAAFEKRFGYVPDVNSAYINDALAIAIKAISDADSREGSDIRDSLEGLTFNDGVCAPVYESDDDHTLSHNATIISFGSGDIETVMTY